MKKYFHTMCAFRMKRERNEIFMKKISKGKKMVIIAIAILVLIAIIGSIVYINVINTNTKNNNYNSANGSSYTSTLLPEYIKEGITLGGVTGTLVDLDTSDATATPEDILEGKTAYVDGVKITGTRKKDTTFTDEYGNVVKVPRRI